MCFKSFFWRPPAAMFVQLTVGSLLLACEVHHFNCLNERAPRLRILRVIENNKHKQKNALRQSFHSRPLSGWAVWLCRGYLWTFKLFKNSQVDTERTFESGLCSTEPWSDYTASFLDTMIMWRCDSTLSVVRSGYWRISTNTKKVSNV